MRHTPHANAIRLSFMHPLRYLQAATQGDDKDNTKAQNNLGFMFANGRGVEKDEAEAVK